MVWERVGGILKLHYIIEKTIIKKEIVIKLIEVKSIIDLNIR